MVNCLQALQTKKEQGMKVMAKCLRHITDISKSSASLHSHRKEGPTCAFIIGSVVTRQAQDENNKS